MRRFAVMSLLIITANWLTAVPGAIAQEEYAQESGDLDLTLSVVLTLSGEESVVLLTLTADGTDEVIDLSTLATDSTGTSTGLLTLPGELEPGLFAVTATGLDLALALQQIRPGFHLTLSVLLTLAGDGFVGDSVVFVTLTAGDTEEVIDLGTLATDSTGAFSGSIVLPDDIEQGTFTMTATGVTGDGATRVLSAKVSTVAAAITVPTTTTTTGDTTTTTSATTATGPAGLPGSVAEALMAGLEAVRSMARS